MNDNETKFYFNCKQGKRTKQNRGKKQYETKPKVIATAKAPVGGKDRNIKSKLQASFM